VGPDDIRDDAPHVADTEAQELASDEPTLDDRHHPVDHIVGHLEAGFVQPDQQRLE